MMYNPPFIRGPSLQPRDNVSNFDKQLEKIKNDKGFIAALDQSGGSTPKALKLYGVNEDAWTNERGNVRRRARDAHAHHHEPRRSTASA